MQALRPPLTFQELHSFTAWSCNDCIYAPWIWHQIKSLNLFRIWNSNHWGPDYHSTVNILLEYFAFWNVQFTGTECSWKWWGEFVKAQQSYNSCVRPVVMHVVIRPTCCGGGVPQCIKVEIEHCNQDTLRFQCWYHNYLQCSVSLRPPYLQQCLTQRMVTRKLSRFVTRWAAIYLQNLYFSVRIYFHSTHTSSVESTHWLNWLELSGFAVFSWRWRPW